MKSGILEVQQRGNLADSDPSHHLALKIKAKFGFSKKFGFRLAPVCLLDVL
jgi:hypothetical protein